MIYADGSQKGKILPQYETREKFAWRPILTTSGKWIWCRRYVKLMKIYWGPAGEDPVIDAEFYTEDEWLLKILSGEYETPEDVSECVWIKENR